MIDLERIKKENLRLIKPTKAYYESYLKEGELDKKYSPNTEQFVSTREDFFEYVSNMDQGINMPKGFVAETYLWLVNDSEFIGQATIRHAFVPHLLVIGGHVGYGIAYSKRGKGYGKLQLHLVLEYIKENFPEITRVLITCDKTNPASAKVMGANGGVFGEENVDEENEKKPVILKYWFKMKENVIETKRLTLTELTNEDFDNLSFVLGDKENMKYYPKPYDSEGVNKWIKWNLGLYAKYGYGLWAVRLKDGTFIGDCGLTNQMIDGENCPEIGYHLALKYHHQGYGIEAAKAVKEYIFRHYPYFKSLYSYCNVENIDSAKLAKRNGMSLVKEYYDPKWNEHLQVYKIDKEK